MRDYHHGYCSLIHMNSDAIISLVFVLNSMEVGKSWRQDPDSSGRTVRSI